MRIAILGTGYVGLITGVCLALKGHEVICVDKNKNIVKKLNLAKPTIYEKGLEKILRKVVRSKNFSATQDINYALKKAKIVIVAVGTPTLKNRIDLKFLKNACIELGKFLKTSNDYLSVIIKSTVVPGTTDTFVKQILERESGKKVGQFGLGMNPEFLREGNALEDFDNPDRIIFGYEDKKTLQLLKKMYSPWKTKKIPMSSRSAELVKYANNIILASQISIINEISNYSHDLGQVNFSKVLLGIHSDKRWSPILKDGKRINPDILSYLIPGCGFGGSCFSKDLKAIKEHAKLFSYDMKIIDAVLKVNESQPLKVVKILKKEVEIKNKKVLVLGLSFKQDTDDVRESPSFKIISQLLKEGAKVTAHDPIAIKNFKESFKIDNKNLFYSNKWVNLIKQHEIVIVVTAWEDYKNINNFNLKEKIIIDCRNILPNKSLSLQNRVINIGNN